MMKRISSLAASFIAFLSEMGGILAVCIIILMMFSVVYEVIMRYVFHHPAGWVIEGASYMLIVCVALALAYTQKVRGHIRVDMVALRLPLRAQTLLDIFTLILASIFCGFLVWTSWWYAWEAWVRDFRGVVLDQVPLFSVMVIIPVGVFLLCLQLLAQIGASIGELLSGGKQE